MSSHHQLKIQLSISSLDHLFWMTLEFGGNVKFLNSPRSGLGGWRGTPLGRRWRSQDAHIGCPLTVSAGPGPISLFKASSCLQSPGQLPFCSRRKDVQSRCRCRAVGWENENMGKFSSGQLSSLVRFETRLPTEQRKNDKEEKQKCQGQGPGELSRPENVVSLPHAWGTMRGSWAWIS